MAVLLVILPGGPSTESTQAATGPLNGHYPGDKAVQATFGSVGEQGPAISPNGRWLAFEYFGPTKKSEVWIMPIEGNFQSARPLSSSPYRDAAPTWSPDSRWIAFICASVKDNLETDQICKVAPEGGQVVQLTHFPFGSTGVESDIVDWLADGRIAFRHDDSIYAMAADGGPMTELLNLGTKFNLGGTASLAGDFYDLRVSPSGGRVAFMFSVGGQDHPRLGIIDLKTGGFTKPLRTIQARFPAWINNNWLLYAGASEGSGPFRIWALCLSTGTREELTEGPSDIEPNFSSRLGAIFFSRSLNGDPLYDYHIWRKLLPESTIRRWSREDEGHSGTSETANPEAASRSNEPKP